MKREKIQSTGEAIVNAVTHIIGLHFGAAMRSLFHYVYLFDALNVDVR